MAALESWKLFWKGLKDKTENGIVLVFGKKDVIIKTLTNFFERSCEIIDCCVSIIG